MAGTVLLAGKNQFFDDAGAPLAGGKLYTYVVGTSTPKSAYSNHAGTTPRTNPIILDARGEAEIYWVGSYDVTLKTSADVTVWGPVTIDQPETAGAAAALEAALVDASTAGLGDAKIGQSAVYAIISGDLIRYSSIAAAVSGVGSNPCEIVVRTSQTLTGNVTLPSTATLRVENRAQITTTGYTLTAPRFQCGRVQCFAGTGAVVLGTSGINEVMCEWWGAVGDATTDSGPAIAAAMTCATLSADSGRGFRVTLGSGDFRTSVAISIPNATVFEGAGRQHTVLRPTTGTSATTVITDKGNASKIFLKNMRVEARAESNIVSVIKLGYGATAPYAQAELYNLYVTWSYAGGPAAAAGTRCIDITTNVATLTEIEAGYAARTFNEGANSSATTYTRCFSIAATDRDFSLIGDATLRDCEIEAPSASCVGVYCTSEVLIDGLVYSQNNSATTNPYAIEVGAAGNLVLHGFRHYNGGGASTLTNVVKDNRTGYPTYWMDDATTSRRISSAGLNLFVGEGIYLKDHKRQSFKVRIVNTGGTMQHRITAVGSTAASSFADRVSGASATLANTPTGADGSTAFASGAKIGSANTNYLWLNTLSQDETRFSATVSIVFNSSSVALTCIPAPTSININGTTRTYLGLAFYNATSGAAYNLTTLGVGLILDVTVDGFIN